jgi:hypothetical protein
MGHSVQTAIEVSDGETVIVDATTSAAPDVVPAELAAPLRLFAPAPEPMPGQLAFPP